MPMLMTTIPCLSLPICKMGMVSLMLLGSVPSQLEGFQFRERGGESGEGGFPGLSPDSLLFR